MGSLVGSIVTADADFAREVVLGVAPWHGRLLVLDRDDAPESTGHGSPLPMLVHGGPGRAGGGEEMGGIRGVTHHMQRTAVQASPRVLAAVTRRWQPGGERTVDGTHPFRKSLADLRVGDTVVKGPRTVTAEDIAHFAEFTGDTFYAHTDAEAAAANPFFDGIVAHGYLILSLAAGLFVDPDPGPVLANYRHRQPSLPDAGLSRRRADRHADLQGDHAARRQPARRGPLGHRSDQTGRLAGRQVRRAHHGCEPLAGMTMAPDAMPVPSPRKRGRPGHDQSSVLAASVAEFNARGYDGTSMDHLARRLRISKSAIYHHVPGKQALLALALGPRVGRPRVGCQRGRGDGRASRRSATHADLPERCRPHRPPALRHAAAASARQQRGRAKALARRRRIDELVANLVKEAVADGALDQTPTPRLPPACCSAW